MGVRCYFMKLVLFVAIVMVALAVGGPFFALGVLLVCLAAGLLALGWTFTNDPQKPKDYSE